VAEESEQVGGISIGASIDDSQVDAGLNALLAKMEAASKRLSAALSIQPGISGAPGAGAAPRAQQPAKITFGAAARQGAQGSEASAFTRRVNEELAKNGQALVDGVVVQIDKAKQQTVQQVSRAVNTGTGQQATSIAVNLDPSEFREQFASFLGDLKSMMAQASQMATISPQLDDDSPGGGGAKSKKSRRKNIRDRSIGTEADPNRIYTFDPAVYAEEDAVREGKANQQRQAALTAHERRRTSTSDAEQRFLNAISAPTTSGGFEQDLRELSYEAQHEGSAGRTSSTFAGNTRTPAQIAAFREEEERRANQQAPRRFSAAEQAELERRRARTSVSGADRYQLPSERPGRAGTGGGRAVRTTEEDLARRSEQQIAISESQRLTAARTSRTFASGLGGFFLGQTRQQAEAASTLRRNEQELAIARRRLNDPEIIRNTRSYRQAQEEVAVAENKVAASLQKVQSFTSGTSAARTLAAVTVAGAAFGLGLKAVDFVIASVGAGLSNLIEIQTGFVGTSSRVTGELAKQTSALHGNVDAVLANAEANAGLSTAGADAVNSQLRLATQIKAGALAQQQASDLFRAAQGAGGAQNGLTGGFGGLFGTSLFGQQLGGGRGLSELIQEDVSSLSGKRGENPLAGISQGLSYVLNKDVRDTVDDLARQQGRPTPGAPFEAALRYNPILGPVVGAVAPPSGQRQGVGTLGERGPAPAGGDELTAYLNDLTAAADRGASATDHASRVQVVYTSNTEEVARAATAAAAAGDAYGVTLARQSGVVLKLNGEVADTAEEYKKALEQIAVGRSRIDPDVLRRQFEFEMPAIIAGAARQQNFALNQQQPSQAALGNLAQPLLPVGTGIAANADEQQRLVAGQQRSTELQKQLNDYYAEGRQVIEDTYRPAIVANFGEAAGAAFDEVLGKITANGQEIAKIQAGISNEQAAYQTAQYNFQLQIAKRTLSDIGGLTGKNFGAGESYLGTLERQNLALSRQGQLLQFNLSQRQINFQTALAGFQAPGVTPEERQARIEEAKIEASFAQKQLDIQRQMFGNQVQIVDISNLRQGADLARQIGLLLQGREVTIDTAQAQEKLALLATQQSILVNKAGTYLGTINNLTSIAFGQIQQLETAAGRAMYSTAYSVLDAFGILLTGLTTQVNEVGGGSTGGGGPAGGVVPMAGGGVVDINQPTRLGANGLIGEVAGETAVVLSHPRALLESGEGGGPVIIQITGDNYFNNGTDMDQLVRRVTKELGRDASLRGLRGVGIG
jgi:hypothetical protein